MLSSLALTGTLAILTTRLAFLTGFGSEETLFLQAVGVGVEMRGLLLAGMIIGAAGVLDDVVIAQSVTVFELATANATLSRREIYRRGLKIGVVHLASMVNTLILAYASAALPLIILFYLYPEPWYLTINRERIAEEIIRGLVGSIGLMMAVPLTTVIAAWVAGKANNEVRSIATSNANRTTTSFQYPAAASPTTSRNAVQRPLNTLVIDPVMRHRAERALGSSADQNTMLLQSRRDLVSRYFYVGRKAEIEDIGEDRLHLERIHLRQPVGQSLGARVILG